MNVYEKLSKARVMLQTSVIKKSGKNTHLNFSYMELDDFLPRVNEINDELKLLTVFSINREKATCILINSEKPEEQIIFESQTEHAKLQGNAAPIQELGSQHTYMRRYLYLMVYEISESDSLDGAIGSDKPKKEKSEGGAPKKEANENDKIDNKKAYVLKLKAGDKLKAVLEHYKVAKLEELTIKQWTHAMKKLELENEKAQPNT
jgi:hypothetical protein